MKPLHAIEPDPIRPRAYSKRLVRLADGEIVAVRPILPTDIFGCYAMYQSLSPETRRYTQPVTSRSINRYMSAVPLALSSIGLLRRILKKLLPTAVMLAYVATNLKGKIIALTYLKLRSLTSEGYVADSGTFIAEDYQSRGLGTYLVRLKIEEGRLFGVRELLADVHSENRKVIELDRKIGFTLLKEIPPNRLLLHLILNNEKRKGLIQ